MYTAVTEPGGGLLERRFGFRAQQTTLRRDTVAGLTTFMVMSYIIFLNPAILSFAGIKGLEGKGLPFDGVLTVTCLVAGVMTIAMGVFANKAYALAPGLGLNAVVAFQLVLGNGLSWPSAMGIIFMEGAMITLLVLTRIREQIFDAVPLELKTAISIGIGFFLIFIGLFDTGIVVRGEGTPVTLGHLTTWPIFVTVIGIVITMTLRAWNVRAALPLGIIALTALAVIINSATGYHAGFTSGARLPDHVVEHPNWTLVGNFDFHSFDVLGVVKTLVLVYTLMLSDFFDTVGTFFGVGKPAGYFDQQGRMADIRKPLLVDSVAAMAGGSVSSSSVTTYIESGAGVEAGGRTGWVAVVCGACFFVFLPFAPLVGMIPPQATAAALILVGYLMVSQLTQYEAEVESNIAGHVSRTKRTLIPAINFRNLPVGMSAMLTMIIMPLTYSITNGIGFGFIAYCLIRLVRREMRDVHPLMWITSAAFLLYFLVPLLQDTYSWI